MTEEQGIESIRKRMASVGTVGRLFSGLCAQCGEVFWTQRDDQSLCSHSCRYIRQQGPGSNTWKGGRTKVWSGHVQVVARSHPFRNKRNTVMEHRLVMEKHIGRYLKPFENVHHKNGVRDDNRIENLELWAKPPCAGQRVEDLVSWVVETYPEQVRGKLMVKDALRDILSSLSNSAPDSLIFKPESTGAGDGV